MSANQSLTGVGSPIPVPPDAGPAVVLYLLSGHGTSRLSVLQIDRADACLAGLVTAPDLLPAVRLRYSAIRHELAAARCRRLSDVASTVPGGQAPDRPHTGPMARLADRPIVRPPSADAVRPFHVERAPATVGGQADVAF